MDIQKKEIKNTIFPPDYCDDFNIKAENQNVYRSNAPKRAKVCLRITYKRPFVNTL